MALRIGDRLRVAPNWLPADTEESVVGTEWHQEAGGALASMLRISAERQGDSWDACEEIELSDLFHEDGSPYPARPDVMVLARPLDKGRAATTVIESGVPLFIAEIASRSTVRNDRDGKRIAYAAIGVPEYVIFDPSERLLGGGRTVEAWRLPTPDARVYVPWLPEPDGEWRSQALGVALRPDPPFLSVRARDGLLIPPYAAAVREREAAQAARSRVEEQARRAEEQARRAEEEQRVAAERIRALENELRRLQGKEPSEEGR